MAAIRIAAAQYPIDRFDGFPAYAAKIGRWVDEAARQGAELLVFPEYGAMELASLMGGEIAADPQATFDHMGDLLPRVDALHADLAARHRVHIVAASIVYRRRPGVTPNVARLFTPRGDVGYQDKQIMTRSERDWGVTPDGPLLAFETALGVIGIAICYDVEFPLIARAQAMAGASVILAPSCTETEFGYSRVRIGAMARALENQCVTVQSPLVGEAPWCATGDLGFGRAAVFGPPDVGFPADGVLAVGALNLPQWLYGIADLAAIEAVRRDGRVLNHRHWHEQTAAEVTPAALVRLT